VSLAAQTEALRSGVALSDDKISASIAQLFAGDFDAEEATAWLLAMEEKTIAPGELAAAVRAVMLASHPFADFPESMDCCGTGGDGAHSLNVSTATAIVLAASGVQVIKHGNRAVSSQAGSADVLQALGVSLELPAVTLETAAKNLGLAFLFAPQFHPGLARIAPLRRAIGKRTFFNVLGPLCNPARPHAQLLGVYNTKTMQLMAETLHTLGVKRALVVHSDDGLDEVSISAPTQCLQLHGKHIMPLTITPQDAGLTRSPSDALRGGDAAYNARALTGLLAGEQGAYRDAVVLNAAAGLWVYGKATTLPEAAAIAQSAIDSGAARKLLADYVALR
jgi:anthranilate phosphoribosyltransferase